MYVGFVLYLIYILHNLKGLHITISHATFQNMLLCWKTTIANSEISQSMTQNIHLKWNKISFNGVCFGQVLITMHFSKNTSNTVSIFGIWHQTNYATLKTCVYRALAIMFPPPVTVSKQMKIRKYESFSGVNDRLSLTLIALIKCLWDNLWFTPRFDYFIIHTCRVGTEA